MRTRTALPPLALGLALVLATAGCDDGAATPSDGRASGGFEAESGCSTATGPIEESGDFVAWKDRTTRTPTVTTPYAAVPSHVLHRWPFQPALDGEPARGMRVANGYVTVAYAPAPLPPAYADLVPPHGLALSVRAAASGTSTWAADLARAFPGRIVTVRIGAATGTLNCADPDRHGTRPHWVSWEQGVRHYDLVGVRDPAHLVVLARTLACDRPV
jgi:hypothetical protein